MKASYYSINLNKASNRLDQFEESLKKKRLVSLVVFYVVLLGAAGALIYRTHLTQQSINNLNAELTEIEDKIARLEASSDYLSPEDIFTLAEVTKGRFVWSEKISLLGNILPKDVALTELSYDSRLNAFMVKGISKVKVGTKDLDLVVSIINVVKANDDFNRDFSDVKFQSSQRIKYREQEIVRFEIACLIKS